MKILFLIFFLGLEASTVFGYMDSLFDAEARYGSKLIMQGRYDSAYRYFNTIRIRRPDLPHAYFYQSAALYSKTLDLKILSPLDTLLPLVDTAIQKALNLPASTRYANITREFFTAAAFAYGALAHDCRHEWFSALMDGKHSISNYGLLLKTDPQDGDALGSLGSYYYWRSVVLQKVPLPFIKDERQFGKETIRKSLHTSRLLTYGIINSLLWIEYNDKNYSQAAAAAQTVLDSFPDNRIFLRAQADCLLRAGKADDARRIFLRLLKEFNTLHPGNRCNQVELSCKLAQCAEMQGRYQEGLNYCRWILEKSYTREESMLLDDFLEYTKQVQKSIRAKMETTKVTPSRIP